MLQTDPNEKRSAKKIIILTLVAGFFITGALLRWYAISNRDTDNPVADSSSIVSEITFRENSDIQPVATMAVVTGKAVAGPVTERPDYVSETEWQVFQNVTRDQPDPDKRLTDLINKILFIKKKTAWLVAEKKTAQRRQLARQLMEMIPGQLETEAIDPVSAKELEDQLDDDLR
jgi:hypothetical protein